MYWESALSLSVEVSIGIAGFSGVIAVLKSGQAKLTEEERVAFEVLMGASGWTMLFGILPLVLADSISGDSIWRVCSALYAVSWIVIAVSRLVEYQRGRISRAVALPIVIVATLITSLLLANTVWLGAYWLYLAVIILQLANAFVMFYRLLRSMWSDA